MAANEIHVGDIGTEFRITLLDGTVPVDISTATTLEVFLLKPDGTTTLTKTASVADGPNGILQYTTIAGDLDTPGTWKIQARAAFDANNDWKSDISKFKVYANIV